MARTPLSRPQASRDGWAIAPEKARVERFSDQNHRIVTIDGMMAAPDLAISDAVLQFFAKITPQYPGVRAPLPVTVCDDWLSRLAPLLDQWFGPPGRPWEMQAWYSLVTTPPAELLPIQRLPHIDGTDPGQIAMMLYLHHTDHGGTSFFRHRSTGLEALGAQDYQRYADALHRDVARTGLPPGAYPTDGAPHFDRIHTAPGAFNSAVFYRGNILHSGVIDNAAPLIADPRKGRLTINAFFRAGAG
jgi:hypothetical protein